MTVHSYENGYRALGRELLLLPVEWTADEWFRVPEGSLQIRQFQYRSWAPSNSRSLILRTTSLPAEIGLQWGFWREYDPSKITVGNGVLTLAARGTSLADTSVLTTAVGGHSYTVEIDVEVEAGCDLGLLLFYNSEHATGIFWDDKGLGVRITNGYVPSRQQKGATRATLRVVNDRQEIDFYFRVPGRPWQRAPGIRGNLRDGAQRTGRLS